MKYLLLACLILVMTVILAVITKYGSEGKLPFWLVLPSLVVVWFVSFFGSSAIWSSL